MQRRAILSVSNKTGIVEFARGLVARGFEIVSTGGTAEMVSGAGILVIPVSAVTGVPEMMDGRVKTLHPAVHAGILARRDHPEDLNVMLYFGFKLIDVVAVNLYPFQKTAADFMRTFDELVEDVDVGGPAMIRAAAKNFRDVIVVTSPDDYAMVLAALDELDGPSLAFRYDLARKAFVHTAKYDTAIACELVAHTEVVDGVAKRTRVWHLVPHDD